MLMHNAFLYSNIVLDYILLILRRSLCVLGLIGCCFGLRHCCKGRHMRHLIKVRSFFEIVNASIKLLGLLLVIWVTIDRVTSPDNIFRVQDWLWVSSIECHAASMNNIIVDKSNIADSDTFSLWNLGFAGGWLRRTQKLWVFLLLCNILRCFWVFLACALLAWLYLCWLLVSFSTLTKIWANFGNFRFLSALTRWSNVQSRVNFWQFAVLEAYCGVSSTICARIILM